MGTCTCGHDQALHHHEASIRRGYRCVCRHIYCPCATYDPAPAGEAASASSRPAGAPIYSKDRCDNGHVLDCCGGCKCEGTQRI